MAAHSGYTPERTTGSISAFMAATPSEVLAVPENTAVYVQADTIASLGEGQVWRWTTTGRTPVSPLMRNREHG
jgi:hypothetical protein